MEEMFQKKDVIDASEKTITKKIRAGYIGICILMPVLSIILQLAIGLLFNVAGAAILTAQLSATGGLEPAEIENQVYQLLMDHMIWAVILYHIIGIVVFGLWYYFSSGRQKLKNPLPSFNLRTVTGIVILGIGLEFFTTTAVEAAKYLIPDIIEQFEAVMEQAGLGEATAEVLFVTVLLAPIGEELLCRGVIYQYAKRATGKFVIANIIQALAFGVMHFNLVQGAYAFILGIALGMVYHRFQTLFAPILLHMVINASAILLVPAVLDPIPISPLICVVILAVTAAVCAVGALLIGKGGNARAKELPQQ